MYSRVQPQEVITKDNVNVADFYSATTKLAQTNLRNVIGETELDQALTSRDMINTKLREILDDATDKWGIRIVRVEIKRIDPPADVTESMHRQMKAERERRASILEAEGEAQAVRKVSDAITTVYTAITNANPDDKVIAIQYLDALKAIANGTASKVFLPYEVSGVLSTLGGIKEIFKEKEGGDN